MDKEVLLAIFGVIGGLAGTIRWLLGYYFKKQDEAEENRSNHVNEEISELKEVVHEHTGRMVEQNREMKALEHKVDLAIAKYGQFQNAQESVLNSLKSFVEANNQRIMSVEGRVVEIGRDLYMLKSKDSKQ